MFAALNHAPHPLPYVGRLPLPRSDDFQITLWALQELQFRSIPGVDRGWEDDTSVVALRAELERAQETELRRELQQADVPPAGVVGAVSDLIARADGPSLSRWVETNGELTHLREFVMHRAAYQTKEADPHSFAIPRLRAGRAKSALLKIQFDEYGNAEPGQAHAELFEQTMDALDVEFDVDVLPAVTLRTNTVLTAFAGRRRSVGACLGHLAVFEMTSVEPMARYAAAIRRVLPADLATRAARFYDVHVAADGFHQELASKELVAGFAEQYPNEANEILFGAAALMAIEQDFTNHLLHAWATGHSSLRDPVRDAA